MYVDSFSIYVTIWTQAAVENCVEPEEGKRGTVTAEGIVFGNTFVPIDAYATLHQFEVTQGMEGARQYVTTFNIRITEYDNGCGYELAGLDVAGGRFFQLSLREESNTAMPGLPEPGTYQFTYPQWPDELPSDTPSFVGGSPVSEYEGGEPCEWTMWLPLGGSYGSVTIDSIDKSQVSGSYLFSGGMEGLIEGEFDVPICNSTVSVEERCCYGADEPILPEDFITGRLDADGGSLTSPGGASVEVPAGALSIEQQITIQTIKIEKLQASK